VPGRIAVATGVLTLVTLGLVSLAGCRGQAAALHMRSTAASGVSVRHDQARPAAAARESGAFRLTGGATGLTGGASGATGSASGATGGASGVTGGALFGGNYPVVPLESSLGRKLAIVRLYYFIGDSFPGKAKFGNLMTGGRTLMVSLDSNGASYASIAAGQHDAAITSFLTSVNQAAIKHGLGSIYVSFEHEPDNQGHRSLGAPVQFLQAWDHVHQLAVTANLDWNDGGRLHWVLTLIHDTYSKSWHVSSFWPGASEVDLIAADGYNSYGCGIGGQNQPQTPADTFGPLLTFAAAHGGLPVFLAEWGSDDIPSGAQATYINEMQSYVASNSSIAGAMYWDTHVGNCNYKVDGNATSIAALAAMGQSAALQGHV
jgi:hypothetical protein